jgi:Tfp pilus assembly ATPase PilU
MVSEIKILASILKESLDRKASDILLSSDFYPSLKIN